MFQIVRVEMGNDGRVLARRPLQPLYDLWDDAMALAEFDASRCAGDYGYDEQQGAWWARDGGCNYRFVVVEVAPSAPFAQFAMYCGTL
jgi:hypothetical protein